MQSNMIYLLPLFYLASETGCYGQVDIHQTTRSSQYLFEIIPCVVGGGGGGGGGGYCFSEYPATEEEVCAVYGETCNCTETPDLQTCDDMMWEDLENVFTPACSEPLPPCYNVTCGSSCSGCQGDYCVKRSELDYLVLTANTEWAWAERVTRTIEQTGAASSQVAISIVYRTVYDTITCAVWLDGAECSSCELNLETCTYSVNCTGVVGITDSATFAGWCEKGIESNTQRRTTTLSTDHPLYGLTAEAKTICES